VVVLNGDGPWLGSRGAATPELDTGLVWPYSLAVDSAHDRVVSTSVPMSMPSWATLAPGSWLADRRDSIIAKRSTRHVQIWRLSDLALLHTIALPPSPDGDHAAYPAEPRVLPDGSVYVNTFSCGLYRLTGLGGTSAPNATFVHAFPGGSDIGKDPCAVAAV